MNDQTKSKTIAQRWFQEVWNEQNVETIRELLAPDAKGHLEGGQEIIGSGAFVTFQQALLQALPDFQVEILNMLADGDDVCTLWHASATHTGAGFGFAPTQNKVSLRGMTWFHISDGKITEGWDAWNYDNLIATLADDDIPRRK